MSVKRFLNRFGRLTAADKDRIWQEIMANCDHVADCWVYRGTPDPVNSYGTKYIQGQKRIVSRFTLAYATRESMDIKADACHDTKKCAYAACCNPQHLDWGSHSENCKRREADEREVRLERLKEGWGEYPQPKLGHETHEEYMRTLCVQESGHEKSAAVGAA